jgi:hypothetical protein
MCPYHGDVCEHDEEVQVDEHPEELVQVAAPPGIFPNVEVVDEDPQKHQAHEAHLQPREGGHQGVAATRRSI